MRFGSGMRRFSCSVSLLAGMAVLGLALVTAVPQSSAATIPPNNTKLTTKTEVFANKRIAPVLSAQSAAKLEQLAARYRDIVNDGGWPKVPNGSYRKGKKNKGNAALNKRLYLEGYLRVEATQGEFEEVFTSATESAVKWYQRNHGLEVTGKVEKGTLAALNVPAAARLATIEANIERLRTYAEGLGSRYLVVNVPSQQIEAVSNGFVYSRHNAVVGRPDRPTPVAMTALSDVIFNPYWNAPASIVERDLIPKMLKNGDVLEEMNIKVFQGFGGPEIDPAEVDWRTAVADDYHFRQEPGETNAMATAKINFPSPFGIYLHDTPEKQYFKTGDRFYSSGCVRVEKVDILLDWILNGQDGIGAPQIAALAETQENTEVKLVDPPQLRVTYLTAYPVGDTVAFHDDVYELDGTGFVVGQPMPVGELSEDGQRFVLKPIPRKPGAVDALEADGFDLFAGSKKKSATPRKKTGGGLYESDGLEEEEGTAQPLLKKNTKTKSAAVEVDDDLSSPAPAKKAKPVTATTSADKKKTATAKKKAFPGLFDWDAHRKKQAAAAKPGTKTAAKKPVEAKPKKVAASDAKKKPDDKKVAAVDTKKKPDDKKVVAADTKKKPDDKKLAVAEAKPKDAAKTPATAKKDECKPAKDGKLPKGCPAVAANAEPAKKP